MDHLQYCNEKSVAAGCFWPYIKLYIAKDQRLALNILLAFLRELQEVAERQLEPEIARLRLHWWQNEIEKNRETPSQHPILQAVAAQCLERIMTPENLIRMIRAAESELDLSVIKDEERLIAHATESSGTVFEMFAAICGGNKLAQHAARRLGAADYLLNELEYKQHLLDFTVDNTYRFTLASKLVAECFLSLRENAQPLQPALWVAAKLLAARAARPSFVPRNSPIQANWIAWRAARQATRTQ